MSHWFSLLFTQRHQISDEIDVSELGWVKIEEGNFKADCDWNKVLNVVAKLY